MFTGSTPSRMYTTQIPDPGPGPLGSSSPNTTQEFANSSMNGNHTTHTTNNELPIMIEMKS